MVRRDQKQIILSHAGQQFPQLPVKYLQFLSISLRISVPLADLLESHHLPMTGHHVLSHTGFF